MNGHSSMRRLGFIAALVVTSTVAITPAPAQVPGGFGPPPGGGGAPAPAPYFAELAGVNRGLLGLGSYVEQVQTSSVRQVTTSMLSQTQELSSLLGGLGQFGYSYDERMASQYASQYSQGLSSFQQLQPGPQYDAQVLGYAIDQAARAIAIIDQLLPVLQPGPLYERLSTTRSYLYQEQQEAISVQQSTFGASHSESYGGTYGNHGRY
jgi:hypothetical protein